MQHSTSNLGTGLLQCDGDMGTGEQRKRCLSLWPVSAGPIWLGAEHTLSPQSCSSQLAAVLLPGSPSPALQPGDRALLERGSSWEGGFAWQDAKTARAVVGFTAGSGLGKSLRQCRNPFFQVLRLKETCN